jgi:hypothetical protein
MRDRTIERSSNCEPFFVPLGNKSIADIVQKTGFEDICGFLWNRLRTGSVKSYYKNGEDAYLVDDDLVMIVEFAEMDNEGYSSQKLHRMVIVTFLGRMSETIELRDLKSYYSWLRHSRRMTLIKNSRKRR